MAGGTLFEPARFSNAPATASTDGLRSMSRGSPTS